MILCDSQSYMNMTENHVLHDKMKHIEIQYFYRDEIMQKGAIKIQYVRTNEKVAYVFTKTLSCDTP